MSPFMAKHWVSNEEEEDEEEEEEEDYLEEGDNGSSDCDWNSHPKPYNGIFPLWSYWASNPPTTLIA